MAREKEGVASMVRRRERRKRWRSTGAVREKERPGWPRGLKGQTGRWVAGLKFEGNSFRNKNWIVEYTKDLEICTRRFGRNFDMGIFPKFF
jgi:hypothetical protein